MDPYAPSTDGDDRERGSVTETGAREDAHSRADRSPSGDDLPTVSAEQLQALLSLMPDAALVVNGDGVIVSVNPQLESMFAHPAGTLMGLGIEALLPERARQRHRQYRSSYMKALRSRSMGAGLELAGRRKDGTEFPVDISLAPLSVGAESLVLAAVRDVTEQRAAAAAQAELATIVASSLDAIVSMTFEGLITSWNPAAESLLGWGDEEARGKHISMLVPEHSSSVLEALLDGAETGQDIGARDTTWRHRDGREIDVAVSVSPLKDRSGSLRGFSSIARDISERKAAEHELRRLLEEEKRLERQHAASAEIRLALLSGSTVVETLTLICRRAAELVDSPVAAICLKGTEGMRVVSGVGLDEEVVGMPLPPGLSLTEKVIESGQLIEFARRRDGSAVQLPESVPDGPTLGVPIVTRGRTEAALILIRGTGSEKFGTSARLFAEALASQAALALELEQARRMREEAMLVGDRERIGRDLHDHVIQRLFAAGLGLQGSLVLIESPPARERLSETIDLLDETIREIRNTIFGLSEQRRGERSLRSQVLALAEEARTGLGFQPAVNFDGPVDAGIPGTVTAHVLAVVREALSNVARHAKATSVKVEISLSGGSLLVSVLDDGVGIARTASRTSGLANLEERARLLGGSCQVAPAEGGGTLLEWRVPVDV